MYVKVLDYEHFNPIVIKKTIETPGWEDIQKEIIELKADNWSNVHLRKSNDDEYQEFMAIRRFKNDLYECIISTQNPNKPDWELYDPSKLSEEPDLSRCVNLNRVLKAAETYAEFGNRDPSLNWRDYNEETDEKINEELLSELDEAFDEDEEEF